MPRHFAPPGLGALALVGTLLLIAASEAQTPTPTPPTRGAPAPMRVPPLFLSTKPEATVVISRHPTGADLVTVTVLAARYPPDSLTKACERVGELTGTPIRGLVVTNTNPATNEGFARASFATNGLISDDLPHLRLTPVLRAFGYAPNPLKTLAILYVGEQAGADTLRTWAIPKGEPYAGQIRLAAQRLPPGPGAEGGGVEYRTLLGELPESAVVLPGAPSAAKPPVAKPAPPGADPTLIVVGVVGVLAAGALVYAVVARPRSGTVIAEKTNRKS